MSKRKSKKRLLPAHLIVSFSIAAVAVAAAALIGSGSGSGTRLTAPIATTGRSPCAATASATNNRPSQSGAIASWAVIGDGLAAIPSEKAAGVNAQVVRLSWRQAEPLPGSFASSYLASKLQEICALDGAGMRVILDWGLQDTPHWLHSLPHSFLVDQFGDRWGVGQRSQGADASDADLIFNPVLRRIAAQYIAAVANRLGRYVFAIRIGGGRFNELSFPTSATARHSNTYWAFSYWAQRESPVPNWKPAEPSPRGQARRFLAWYTRSLTGFEDWQIRTLRQHFAGPMIVLFPGWGLRPGQAAASARDNLDGQSLAEVNGETQRGLDVAAEVAAIREPDVWVETTWGDARAGDDASASPAQWNPIHYLRSLLGARPDRPQLWAENTGQGSPAVLRYAVQQAERYRAAGFVWFNEAELLGGRYATLTTLRQEISKHPLRASGH